MRCPICGRNSVDWDITNYHDGKATKCALVCEFGDFMTDETSPSKVMEEYRSAIEWNERNRRATND